MRRVAIGALALFLGAPFATAQDPDVARKVEDLIQALGDESIEGRKKAVEDLAQIGRPALDPLKKATEAEDPEVKKLAQEAIEKIYWGRGFSRVQQYVQERSGADASKVEPMALKSIQRWFPDTRFYEIVETPDAAGGAAAKMAMMGNAAQKSVFAVRREEDAFYRISIKGVMPAQVLRDLVAKENVKLASEDDAFDFAIAYMELQWSCMASNNVYYGYGAGSRFEKTAEGYELQNSNYGTYITFKVDAEGRLTGIQNKANWQYAQYLNSEDKGKLELEKLKLEVELLTRQLEALKKEGK